MVPDTNLTCYFIRSQFHVTLKVLRVIPEFGNGVKPAKHEPA